MGKLPKKFQKEPIEKENPFLFFLGGGEIQVYLLILTFFNSSEPKRMTDLENLKVAEISYPHGPHRTC